MTMTYVELEKWCSENNFEYIEDNSVLNPDKIYIAFDGLNIAELSTTTSGYVRTHYLEIDGFKFSDVNKALKKTFELALTPICERVM